MITVKPYGGLANRLRVIDSALWLANAMRQPLTVIWERSFEINCRYHKLLTQNAEFQVIEGYANPVVKRIKKRVPEFLKRIGIKYPLGYELVLIDEEVGRIVHSGNDFSFCAPYRKIYIQTSTCLNKVSSFEWFKPTDEIAQLVRKCTSDFSKNTIGIHIRRADNLLSTRHSPLGSFIDMMKRELEKNQDCYFFLATDSLAEEERLKRIFGDRILTNSKVIDRNSEEGIVDAMVDLCCLASTTKIIGSYYSSFSEVASRIKGIELKVAYV